ncbi:MAG: hypothetical protein HKN30_11810 [Sulfitobacter sp.]|nr:hypothetical protein [Sulfitobacter sp.]
MSSATSPKELQNHFESNARLATVLRCATGLVVLIVTAVLAHHLLSNAHLIGNAVVFYAQVPTPPDTPTQMHMSLAVMLSTVGPIPVQFTLSLLTLAFVVGTLIFCPVEFSLLGMMPPLLVILSHPISSVILAGVGAAVATSVLIRWALRHAALRQQAETHPFLLNFTETV